MHPRYTPVELAAGGSQLASELAITSCFPPTSQDGKGKPEQACCGFEHQGNADSAGLVTWLQLMGETSADLRLLQRQSWLGGRELKPPQMAAERKLHQSHLHLPQSSHKLHTCKGHALCFLHKRVHVLRANSCQQDKSNAVVIPHYMHSWLSRAIKTDSPAGTHVCCTGCCEYEGAHIFELAKPGE